MGTSGSSFEDGVSERRCHLLGLISSRRAGRDDVQGGGGSAQGSGQHAWTHGATKRWARIAADAPLLSVVQSQLQLVRARRRWHPAVPAGTALPAATAPAGSSGTEPVRAGPVLRSVPAAIPARRIWSVSSGLAGRARRGADGYGVQEATSSSREATTRVEAAGATAEDRGSEAGVGSPLAISCARQLTLDCGRGRLGPAEPEEEVQRRRRPGYEERAPAFALRGTAEVQGRPLAAWVHRREYSPRTKLRAATDGLRIQDYDPTLDIPSISRLIRSQFEQEKELVFTTFRVA